MNNDFKKNFAIETKFTRTIKAILGNFFIKKDIKADLEEGTDFAIFTFNPFRVGVRLRRYKYYQDYRNEFTIRYSLWNGKDTEFQKIKNGLVDYILYGFLNSDETKIIQYFIGDLKVFRNTEINPKIFSNKGTHDSELAVYKIDQFPDNFILHSYGFPQKNAMESEKWYKDLLVDN